MTIPRLFQRATLHPGEILCLSHDAAHYLAHVRRAREGQPLIIFNGEGGEFTAEILSIKKDLIQVRIGNFQAMSRESPLCIHLAQGIARGEKMDFIIQKAVELGVKTISPLLTERSTVKLDAEKRHKRQQHWQAIAISACEQSGRTMVPTVALPLSLTEWLHNFTGTGIILSPNSPHKLSNLPLAKTTALSLVIGPEGGLSDTEVTTLQENNFLSLNLGPRILRTETAPLAVISLLQAQFGDMG